MPGGADNKPSSSGAANRPFASLRFASEAQMAEGATPLAARASAISAAPDPSLKNRPQCFRLPPLASSAPPLLPFPLRPFPVRCRSKFRLKTIHHSTRAQASNVGTGDYGGEGEERSHRNIMDGSTSETSLRFQKPLSGINYQMSIAGVLLVCAISYMLIVSLKGGPSAFIAALAKSGFTAAFTLIFVSEIGDKTFFIAALLAMQYDKAMVLSGSMAALALMTVLSVVIGRLFNSVPAQFQTTLPLGEYAAVALLAFFGLNSIRNAWEMPSNTNSKQNAELGELVEAEELVKEKVATKLTNPFEVLWKSFSLVFFAEWGDRSMLATIALGAAQSPWGVAGGAIAGHLFATSIAILGGAFLANYISEKLVGYLGGVLFLIFAAATLLGIF